MNTPIASQNFNNLNSDSTFTDDNFPSGSQDQLLTNESSLNQDGPGINFQTFWTDTRGNKGPLSGSESGDFIGVNSFSGSNAPNVSPDGTAVSAGVEQNFEFNDGDGRLDLTFAPIDLSGFNNRILSFDYWINETGFESNDAFTATLSDGNQTTTLLSFSESQLEANTSADDGSANWNTVKFDLESAIASAGLDPSNMALTISADTNSGSENIFVDNVLFAEGDGTDEGNGSNFGIQESFESEPGTTYTLSNPFDDGSFDYFDRYAVPNDSNAARDDFQAGWDGNFGIQGQDHDGEGGTATRTITINDINITGGDNVVATLALGALASEPNFFNYEASDNDGIEIFATVDGGDRALIGSFAPSQANDAGDLLLDTDLDGVGDGARLNADLQDFSFAIPETGDSLDLDIELTSTDSFEPLAVDNVRVEEVIDFQESFESEPGTTYTLSNPFDDGNFDYFDRYAVPDNDNPARDDFQAGWDGNFGIQSQDHDGERGSATRTIAINDIDIANGEELFTTISIGALASEPNFFNYDVSDNDGIEIFATVDGDDRALIGSFAPSQANDAGDLLLDTDLDGVGDGARLNADLQDFSFAIPETGDSLDLEIELTSTDSFEPLAIDNVRVRSGGIEEGTRVPAQEAAIYEIQGASHTSPLNGERVVTTGIVTAVAGNGFYLQDPEGDGNTATSDAIFVFTGNAPSLSLGDEIEVEGTVEEFFPGGSSTGNLSTTEIVDPEISEPLSTDNPLPSSVVLGAAGRIPPSESIDDDAFSSFDPDSDGIDFFESLEAMRVTANDPLAVSGTNDNGEIFTVVDNGANASGISDRGTLNISPDDFNPEKVQIDVNSSLLPGFETPEVNVGAQFSDVTGVISYNFGNFEVQPTEAFSTVNASPLEPEVTDLQAATEQLTVASYNVLNLDSNDNDGNTDVADGRFDAIATQIVNNLQSPDIIGLQEIQDNSGSADTGETSASETLQKLVDEIAAAGGPEYEFIDNTFIGDKVNGGDPAGNIRTAFLYNPDRTDLVEGSVQPIGDQEPGSPYNGARLPLAATFSINGKEITLVNNHFSSKGGSAPIFGVEQPFAERQEDPDVNGSLDERQAQATGVKEFIDELFANDANANVVALGDLNEFEFVSPVEDILGSSLQNLTNELDANERYSFIFQGNSQQLDHILVSDSLTNSADLDLVHVNTEFAETDSRASDHDPVLARLNPGVKADLGNGKDTFDGTLGNDIINGGNGPDQLNGSLGNDVLTGGNGPDIINGGAGNDTVTGGNGPDTFILGVDTGVDSITDFETPDTLQLLGDLSLDMLSFVQDGSNVLIRADSDLLAIVNDTTVEALSWG